MSRDMCVCTTHGPHVTQFLSTPVKHCFSFPSYQVKTKCIKEVVAFYYFWKKTAGYKHWKQQYIADVRTHPHMVTLGDHDATTTAAAVGAAVAVENSGATAGPSSRSVGEVTS